MVEFDVPQPLTEELLAMIPAQREAIDKLFVDGKLLSYSLSEDRSRVWAIMLAKDEAELIESINALPMTLFMEFDYQELMFHNTVHLVPSMSLN